MATGAGHSEKRRERKRKQKLQTTLSDLFSMIKSMQPESATSNLRDLTSVKKTPLKNGKRTKWDALLRRQPEQQQSKARGLRIHLEKLHPSTGTFVPLHDTHSARIKVRAIQPKSPCKTVIDLTNSPPPSRSHSPIDLCSLSNGSFESRTSTPKSTTLTNSFNRCIVLSDDRDSDIKMEPFTHDDCSIIDGHIPETDGVVPKPLFPPIQSANHGNTPMMNSEAPLEDDGPELSRDRYRSFTKLLQEQMRKDSASLWNELTDLARERGIPLNVCPSAGQQQSVGIASTDHHPIMDCLDSRMSGIFTRVHVPVQEALMFVAPSGSVPSSEFMHVLCEKIILHKESSEFQKNSVSRLLHQILVWYPPGMCATVRKVYERAFRLLGRDSRFCAPFYSNMMHPSHAHLSILKWINNVFLSDLHSCHAKEDSEKPLVLLLGGIDYHFKDIANLFVKQKLNNFTQHEEELLEESLVTLQLHATALYQYDSPRTREFEETFAAELSLVGIQYKSKLLGKIKPARFSRHLRKHLKS